jgi:hypothetical protein
LTGIAGVTLLVHWTALHAAHVLLPRDRTALFFVLFATLIFGCALAVRFQHAGGDAIRPCGMAVLIATAIYFAGCLRLEYFREWKFDADTRNLYRLASDLNQRCGITSFSVDWRYASPLDFYSAAYGNHSLPKFADQMSSEFPADRDAYLVYYDYPDTQKLIQDQKLQVIYRDERSSAAVAIRGCKAGAPPHTPN